MVTTSIYVNTSGKLNDDDLYESIETDGGLDRINRLKEIIEEILYDMENEESFIIKIIDE